METRKEAHEVKARKNHLCNYCNNTINKGDIYFKSTHVYDGLIYDWKSHSKCKDLVNMLNMEGDEGITDEIFSEYVYEAYNFRFPHEIESLSFDRIISILHSTLKTMKLKGGK